MKGRVSCGAVADDCSSYLRSMVRHWAFAGLFAASSTVCALPQRRRNALLSPANFRPSASPPRKVCRVNGVKFLASNVIDWPSFRRRTP